MELLPQEILNEIIGRIIPEWGSIYYGLRYTSKTMYLKCQSFVLGYETISPVNREMIRKNIERNRFSDQNDQKTELAKWAENMINDVYDPKIALTWQLKGLFNVMSRKNQRLIDKLILMRCGGYKYPVKVIPGKFSKNLIKSFKQNGILYELV